MCINVKNEVEIILFLFNIFLVTLNIMQNDENPKPQNMEECRKKKILAKMEKDYACRITIINKTRSFGLDVQMPKSISLLGTNEHLYESTLIVSK